MTTFAQLQSVHKLNELAKDPFDLTAHEALSAKRIDSMIKESYGLKLFYSTERVCDDVLSALDELATECGVIEKMKDMQSGKVINRIEGVESENRAVLHTAMRDFFDHTQTSDEAKLAAQLAYKELEKLTAFLKDIEVSHEYTDIVQVGIGGSDLGPRAIYLALKAYRKPGRRAHFFSNVDPDDGIDVMLDLDLSKTLFVIVSKSGSTLETSTNEELVRDRLKKAGLDPKNHLIAVTGQGSPMDDPQRYLASFYIWDYIGGRYSVTSMVGGVVLAFALGMDRFIDFLKGASVIDKSVLKKEGNLPLMSALLSVWNRNFLNLPTQAIIPYSQALSRFPAHLQQLNMESNGKRIDRHGRAVAFDTGAIYWGEPGTNGQHSFFQLIHQGTTTIPVEFIGFARSQHKQDILFKDTYCQEKLLANLFAQSVALATGQKSPNPNKVFTGNRPTRILFAEKLDPYTLGQLLSYYEHAAAFQGFLWDINSFDQEGVQLGKVLAMQFLDLFAQKNKGGDVDSKGFPIGAAYLRHIDIHRL